MATLTIRNLDDQVVERLKAKAKDNGRSLEAEVRVALTEVSNRLSAKELRARAEHISAMTLKVPQTDATAIIREFRDR